MKKMYLQDMKPKNLKMLWKLIIQYKEVKLLIGNKWQILIKYIKSYYNILKYNKENVWHHSFYHELKMAPEDHRCFIAESPLNSK